MHAEGPSAQERRMSMSLQSKPVSLMPAVPVPKAAVVPPLSGAGANPAAQGLNNLTLLAEAAPHTTNSPPRSGW
jgi:hypothetical protein